MNKLSTYLAAAIISITMTPMAFANHHEAKQKKCLCPKMNKLNPSQNQHNIKQKTCQCSKMKKLNLSKEQQETIKNIRKQARQNIKEERNNLKAIRKQMRALIKTEKLDEGKINALIEQRNKIMGKLNRMRLQMKHGVYNTLNADQKVKFEAMMEKRKGHHKN